MLDIKVILPKVLTQKTREHILIRATNQNTIAMLHERMQTKKASRVSPKENFKEKQTKLNRNKVTILTTLTPKLCLLTPRLP